MLGSEHDRATAGRRRCYCLIENHALRVATKLLRRVEPQPADSPIDVERILKLEWHLVGRSDQQKVERYAVIGIDNVHTNVSPLEPIIRTVAVEVAIRALEYLVRRGFGFATVKQRLE